MPEDDKDFYHSFELLHYLIIHKKIVTLFIPEYKYNLIPEKDKFRSVTFTALDKNKLNLPSANLVERIQNKNYDVVMDLNRKGIVFFIAVSNIVNSKLRFSFNNEENEGYYNFLFNDNANNSEISFRNLLNFLQMF